MTGRAAGRAAVALLLAASAGGCRYLTSGSDIDPYRCDDPAATCPAGRVCRAVSSGERFCVVAGDGGAGGTDAGESGPPGTDAGSPGACDCDDGDWCNGVETCDPGGACVPGTPLDCSVPPCGPPACDGVCVRGVCDPMRGCVALPLADGTPCSDGLDCTVADYCVAGVCTGDPDPCGGDGCDSYCVEGTGCVPGPAPEDTTCNDGLFCTSGDHCVAGACTGAPRSCDDANDCTTGDTCDAAAGLCVNDATGTDGAACEDGFFCTLGSTCSDGFCSGTLGDPCTVLDDQCNTGACSEGGDGSGSCEAIPFPNGTACDDGDSGTSGDACSFGTCTGS